MHDLIIKTLKSDTFGKRFRTLSGQSGVLSLESEAKHLHTLLSKNSYLASATPESILDQMYTVASIGLSLNPALQQCTLVPRSMKRKDKSGRDQWVVEASYMPMYRGLVKLGFDSNMVSSFSVENVYQADEFDISQGTSPIVNHKPSLGRRGVEGNEYIGTYVVTELSGSAMCQIEWVPSDEMYEIREKSDAYKDKQGNVRKSSPWVNYFGEMAKKSALKRAIKRWPQSDNAKMDRLAEAIEEDNKIEARPDDIEGQTVEPISLDQATAIKDRIADIEKNYGISIDRGVFCDLFKADSIEAIPADEYAVAMHKLESRERLAEKQANGE